MDDLKKILESIKKASEIANIQIITGDTKVVNKGGLDGIFINTAGVGIVEKGINISADNLMVGDKIIVSGYIGDHGISIMSVREGLVFDNPVKSDTAPLNEIVASILESNSEVHAMRDPTRGGVASTLNEFVQKSNVGIIINEIDLPIREEVTEACEILGFDPLYVANEGKMIAVVEKGCAENVLGLMKRNPFGKDASIIGEVTEKYRGKVILKTKIGTTKIVDMLTGEQLPRIC